MARNTGRDQRGDDNQRGGQEVALIQRGTPTVPAEAMAAGYDLGQWRALTDSVFPSAKTIDGVMLAINYCKARKLDVFKRMVHVVPMWSSALGREVETVWPGIAEVRATASRTGNWAGNDECVFGRVMRQAFRMEERKQRRGGEPYMVSASSPMMEFPEWAQVTVYKIVAGHRVPFVGPKVRFLETFSGQKGLRVPNDRWQLAPYQMLEKCAMAAALRNAFPEELGDEWTAEEMAGKDIAGMPTVAAVYTEVEEGEGQVGAEQDQQGSAGESSEEQGNDLNGWVQEELDDYLDYIETGLGRMNTIKRVDEAIAKELHIIDRLPAAQREKVDVMVNATRKRIADAAAARQKAQGGAQKDNKPAQEPQEASNRTDGPNEPENDDRSQEAARGGGDAPFIRNLRLKIEEAADLAELADLEEAEKRAIRDQPEADQKEAWRMFDARRLDMRNA